jgi:uncharacterized protein YndB with AHSA1/START domain
MLCVGWLGSNPTAPVCLHLITQFFSNRNIHGNCFKSSWIAIAGNTAHCFHCHSCVAGPFSFPDSPVPITEWTRSARQHRFAGKAPTGRTRPMRPDSGERQVFACILNTSFRFSDWRIGLEGASQVLQQVIRKEIIVNASVREVWEAWTTAEGAVTFFAPAANIELSIGGSYELLFDLDAPEGSRGGEGLKILSFLPEEMLSFEWNAPPQYHNVRKQHTWVVVQFFPCSHNKTKVRLTHLGWRKGEEWDKVFQYFKRAWDVVLGRLQHRFAIGSIDWSNPYSPPYSVTYEVT